MPTRVKICGVTRWEDARLAVELGAAAVGFNFHLPSPRCIEPSAARAIVAKLPPLVTAVGIFANETDGSHVAAIARAAGIGVVQLHGPQYPSADGPLADFRRIRAVAVKDGFNPEALQAIGDDAVLLDAYDPKLLGGTGKPFNWALAKNATRYATIILAGGLTAENVAQAIREVQPFAVDVASGVESAPGIKDAERMRRFFAAVSEADAALGAG
jgi:phosphoribosylanthranilate isomerase